MHVQIPGYTTHTPWPPLVTNLGFNEALPAFEMVRAKGWKERNRNPSFLLEATMGLAQCNLASLCVCVSQAVRQPRSWLCCSPVTGW